MLSLQSDQIDPLIVSLERDIITTALEWEAVAPIDDPRVFYRHAHSVIWSAVLDAQRRGLSGYASVRQILIDRSEIDAAGDSYLKELTQGGVPMSAASLRSVADQIREAAEQRALRAMLTRHASAPSIDYARVRADLEVIRRPSITPARAFTLPDLEMQTFEHRAAILERAGSPVLREGHLGQVHAFRGLGKTLFLQTIELIAASAGAALSFRAPEPVNVLRIDGEMAGEELRDRYAMLREKLGLPAPPNLVVLGADWQDDFLPRLDTPAGQAAVEPFVAAANLIVIDNRSTLFDPEAESDPAAWQPAQEWLLSLRRRHKAVLLVHHANRQGGARGHSRPEDITNLLIKLSRPDGYTADQGARFVVEFEKARGVHGAAVASFTAGLEPDGWHVEASGAANQTVTEKLLDYVRLAHAASDSPTSANAAIRGASVNRRAGLAAWAELLRDGRIVKRSEGGFYVP